MAYRKNAVLPYSTAAPGVRVYKGVGGVRKYRIECMVNGSRLQRTVPEEMFVQAERQRGYHLSQEEEALIASQLRLQVKRHLEAGECKDEAWAKTCGTVRHNVPFDEFVLQEYLPSVQGEISNSGHEYTARKLARDYAGRPLTSIHYDDVRQYTNHLRLVNRSESRIRDYTSVMRGVFSLAGRQGLVQADPTRRTDRKEHKMIWPTAPVSKKAETYASASEVAILIEAANSFFLNGDLAEFDSTKHKGNLMRYDTRWFGDLVSFAFETGIRRGAIFQLEWNQITSPTEDSPHGSITIRAEQVKTRRGRTVPLSKTARDVIERQAERREHWSEEYQADPRIFRGRRGQPNPDYRLAWKSIVRKAEHLGLDFNIPRLKRMTFHDLRASWVIDLLNRGAHVNEAQLVGGWSTLTAMNRYIRATEDDTGSVQKALENRRKR